MSIETYLSRLPTLSHLISDTVQKPPLPFKQLSILLVHHLTGEIIGTIAALRKLGCLDIVTVFVGYNSALEKTFAPEFNDIPNTELRFYVLNSESSNTAAELFYSVSRTFLKQPPTDDAAALDDLDANLKSKSWTSWLRCVP